MKPSKRQAAIFDCWENEDVNIMIRAVAGSGKTTTLMQLISRSKTKTLFLAFNKSIQTEIEERLLSKGIRHARALTMHSLGLKAIRKSYTYRLESGKNFKMVMALEKQNKKYYKDIIWEDKVKLNNALMNANDVSRMFLIDKFEDVVEQMEKMSMSVPPFPVFSQLWEELKMIRKDSYKGELLVIDFLDMIYVPVLKDLRIPTSPKYLMIDEAQDLNLVQHAIIDKIIAQGVVEKWIAVGDSNQSIYGFAGAHASSFDMFAKKDNVKELPLDICYRCPSKVIELANDVYDVMQGFKEEEGEVAVKSYDDIETISEGELVICRNTGPLVWLFFNLVGAGKKVFLKGDDILGEMKKFLTPHKFKTLQNAYYDILVKSSELTEEANKSKNQLKKFHANKYSENLGNYKIIMNHFRDRFNNVAEMLVHLQVLFQEGDPKKGVTLSTIHKSKGLESATVYILNEDLIPSKFAKTEEDFIQENNLKYVARTRASERMFFLNIDKKIMEAS